jgi:hypothetical protein
MMHRVTARDFKASEWRVKGSGYSDIPRVKSCGGALVATASGEVRIHPVAGDDRTKQGKAPVTMAASSSGTSFLIQ